jgi:hypothetical protein
MPVTLEVARERMAAWRAKQAADAVPVIPAPAEPMTRAQRNQLRRDRAAQRRAAAAARDAHSPDQIKRISDGRRAQIRAEVNADPNAPLVRRLRIARGWTLVEAADAAGISVTSWRKVECGQPVNASTAAHVARALDIDPEKLR